MTKPMRRLILALILIVIITVAGTIGGFFNIHDLINRVSIQRIDNQFGGKTTTKSTTVSKHVTWTKYYAKEWVKPIGAVKPYMLQEVLDKNNQVINYMYIYRTEKSIEDTVAYYKENIENLDITSLDENYISIDAEDNQYKFSITVKMEDTVTEVTTMIDKKIN
ncbi:MAG: hypothetical protein N4A50_05110 [Vallitalea sp.]|jgi:hypothetical protein|nr:hypothetical protein [Vallitalea sp.]